MASYCAIGEVEGLVQMGAYSASTTPTNTQVTTFMDQIAGAIYARLVQVIGSSAGTLGTVSAATDAGAALAQVCEHLNMLGAAALALEAAGASEEPLRTERVNNLWAQYYQGLETIDAVARQFAPGTSTAVTHISAGEVTEGTIVSREQQGLAVTDATEF